MNSLLNFYNDHEKQVILGFGLLVGLGIGLLFGWVIWPTQFDNATPGMLRSDYRDDYISWVAEEYEDTGDIEAAQHKLGMDITGRGRWRDEPIPLIQELANSRGAAERPSLQALAQDLSTAPSPDQGPTLLERLKSVLRVLFVLLVVVAVCVLGYLGVTRLIGGKREISERAIASRTMEPVSWEDGGATPLAQFVTTYTLGDDFYDPSFSIEKENGDFMGECGVGISESIGAGDPKKVTAIEIWLFDKNDIRTITKVLMSQHAFNDDALRASLGSKGDLVMVQPGSEVTLDTATMVLRARILDLEYGEGQLPPNSFFKRISMELGAWVKPGAEDVEMRGPEYPDMPSFG
ncbi:MAG: hypothetical protein JXD18_04630 [Anaerolineae bacterium]|nr:hypothetical protein [Anaerolineae bacterium]